MLLHSRGFRWLDTTKSAGESKIHVIIDPLDDMETLKQALIENLQREDMHPMDEARAYKRLHDAGHTHRQTGDMVAKDHTHIANRIALCKESEVIQAMVGQYKGGVEVDSGGDAAPKSLSEYHVRLVRKSGIEDLAEREKILVKAAEEDLTAPEALAVADANVAADTVSMTAINTTNCRLATGCFAARDPPSPPR